MMEAAIVIPIDEVLPTARVSRTRDAKDIETIKGLLSLSTGLFCLAIGIGATICYYSFRILPSCLEA